jgi:hypothetical protein
MAKLFGFTIGRDSNQNVSGVDAQPSIVDRASSDGAIEVAEGGVYGTFLDLEGKAKNETDLINKYREMALQPECDAAVQDIINEAIVTDSDEEIVKIQLDKTGLSSSLKASIRKEFEVILERLNFNNDAYEHFRRWYVDGRINFHVIIDKTNPRKGITALRYIDPRKIRKIREPIKKKDPDTGVTLHYGAKEYFIYNEKGLNAQTNTGTKVAVDSILFGHSGLMDSMNNIVYSHLHKAIKPMNQLRMLEDAVVIYRISRAPERRIFYIDVGNLPKAKAEQHLNEMMIKHKNKLVYNASTGEVSDDRKVMTMLEDFWIPRREGGRGTEISTLPGGQNLGEMDDVEYFKKKLYKALNVPVSRLEAENSFNIGRTTEISRDEIKFAKYIHRLRMRFTSIFDDALELQLSLKGIMSRAEWQKHKEKIFFDWTKDNYFTELKETEMLSNRMDMLGTVDQYIGNFFSKAWVQKEILRMSEQNIIDMQKEIDAEGGDSLGFGPNDPNGAAFADSYEPDKVNTNSNTAPEKISEKPLNPEEKKLVESMTKFMDTMASTEK